MHDLFEGGGARTVRSAFVLGDLASSMRRNWLLVALGTVLGAGAGYLAAADLPDRYSAEAMLISDAALPGIVALGSGDAPPTVDPSATTTIVDTIGVPVVLERAVKALPPDLMARLVTEMGVEETPADVQGAGDAGAQDQDAVERRLALTRRHVAGNLEVANSGRSYVILVRYQSEDPDLAAAIANAVAEGYLLYRAELKQDIYARTLDSLGGEIGILKEELLVAERTAQTTREQVRVLAIRSEALTGRQQDEAIAESADLYAQQREAEREAEATAAVYERLLFNQRGIQSRIGAPDLDVRLFAPAVVPLQPGGFNVKPVLLALGLVGGLLAGASVGLLRDRLRRRVAVPAVR